MVMPLQTEREAFNPQARILDRVALALDIEWEGDEQKLLEEINRRLREGEIAWQTVVDISNECADEEGMGMSVDYFYARSSQGEDNNSYPSSINSSNKNKSIDANHSSDNS